MEEDQLEDDIELDQEVLQSGEPERSIVSGSLML